MSVGARGRAREPHHSTRRAKAKDRGAPPGPDSWLRVAGVWCLAAKLFLIPIVIDPLGADVYALPKSAVSRAILYVMCVVAAAYLIRRRPPVRADRLAVAVVAVVAVSGLATVLAIDPVSALYGAHRRLLGFTSILDGAALAGGLLLFVRRSPDLVLLACAAAAGTATVTVYGLVQATGWDPIPSNETRIASLIGNSTSLGGYLVISAVMLMTAALLTWARLGRTLRAFAVSLIAGALLLAILTGARIPTFAILPSVAFAIAIARRAGWVVPRVSRRVVMITAGVALIASIAFVAGTGAERMIRLAQGRDDSATERGFIYDAALRASLARPLLGVGPDGMTAVYPSLRQPETAQILVLSGTHGSTHSWLLHWLLGTGVVGLVAFTAMVGIAVRQGWISARSDDVVAAVGAAGIVAYLAQGLLTINSVPTDLLLWASIGLVAVAPFRPHLSGDVPARRQSAHRLDALPAAVAIAIGIGLALFSVNLLEANRAVRTSDAARARGAFGVAERAAQDAVRRDPQRANSWNVLGLAYSRRQPDRAIAAFERATTQAPRDPVYAMNLAAEAAFVSQGSASRRSQAEEHALRALELDPHGRDTIRRASEVFAVIGQIDRAIELTRRGLDLAPDDAALHRWLGELYVHAGRPRDAVAEIEWLIRSDPTQASVARADLPPERRLPLAALYRQLGELDRVRELVRPPSVVDVDVSCTARNGSMFTAARSVRPRCIRILYSSEERLIADPADRSAVTAPANYLIDGVPLPVGTVVELVENTATIQLPATATPPPSGARVVVRNVSNALGQRLVPDPTDVLLR
jgi:tetratricopeptide (TPR) repeat protein